MSFICFHADRPDGFAQFQAPQKTIPTSLLYAQTKNFIHQDHLFAVWPAQELIGQLPHQYLQWPAVPPAE